MSQIQDIVAKLGGEKAPILSVLLAVQDTSEQRYISEKSISEIASALNVTRCRIYSTASFYHEISLQPRGIHLIRVCGNAPCENANSAKILQVIENELDITIGKTTKDGIFTLESVNCLGACYMSPAIKVDDTIYGNLTPEKVIDILDSLRKEVENEQTA